MLIYSNPESDIHPIFLGSIETNAPDEFSCIFFDDKILEYFPIPDRLLLYLDELEFLLICREKWTHIEILIREAELLSQLTDINSSIEWEWNKH